MRQLASAVYLNSTVGDKHHREITNLNVLANDKEAVSPAASPIQRRVLSV